MNDAEYIAAIAGNYKNRQGPELQAHYERLIRISAALAAVPAHIDCGEAGCADGCCGNAKCLPSAAAAQQPWQYTPQAQERIQALELEVRQLTEQIVAMRHAPTPQADSQPAPANTRQIAECYGDCPEDPKTCANPCKFEGRAARAPADSVPTGNAHGWVTIWPTPDGLHKPVYSPGKHKPSYGPELDAKLCVYPVFLSADSVLEDAARLERERICAAIKAEDDYCVEHGDYMLDSDDCIKIVRGEWVRPDYLVDAARKQGANHD